MSFEKAVRDVMKRGGYSKKAASAIIAKTTREASEAAKRRNSKLRRVK